jgi:hypothetical protein
MFFLEVYKKLFLVGSSGALKGGGGGGKRGGGEKSVGVERNMENSSIYSQRI